MNIELLNQVKKLELRSIEITSEKDKEYIYQLPKDYTEFMSKYNGGTGFINENNYIDLWPLETVIQLNPYFPEEEFSNEVIIIGSNGGGTLYGYDLIKKIFFETDEYQMSRIESTFCGNDFLGLLKYLEAKK